MTWHYPAPTPPVWSRGNARLLHFVPTNAWLFEHPSGNRVFVAGSEAEAIEDAEMLLKKLEGQQG